MTKEQYNSLADYQKEVYDKCNRGNKGALIAGWIFGGLVAVVSLILMVSGAISSGTLGGFGDVVEGILAAIMIGVLMGGIFPGLAHLGFIFKKIGFHGAILLWIVLGIFLLMLYGFILMFIWYAGAVLLIIDTILFIMKKPLIYRWEDARVLEKAEKQAGAYINRQ